MTNEHYLRVCAIRTLMMAKGWDAVILRGSDPHSSEYLAPRYQAVTWLSGFTGEAGDIVVTVDHAGLWTDSRYFIQAVRQLDGTGIELHKTRLPESVDIPHWLAQQGCRRVACDSLCENAASMEEIREACSTVTDGFELTGVPDLIDAIWEERPAVPVGPVITLDEETVGMTRSEKLQWIRGWLEEAKADYILVSALDEVAWMLNVRGSDIDYNPVVFSYLLIGQDSAQWFVRKEDLAEAVESIATVDEDTLDSYSAVEQDGVSVEAYDNIGTELERLASDNVICYDPASLNGYLAEIVAGGKATASPIALKKAIKTPAEIEGMREGYLESVKFLTDIEKENLPFAARLFPYMQAVRFFADYINGDTYYKIAYPEHNLVRTRNQIALFASATEKLK